MLSLKLKSNLLLFIIEEWVDGKCELLDIEFATFVLVIVVKDLLDLVLCQRRAVNQVAEMGELLKIDEAIFVQVGHDQPFLGHFQQVQMIDRAFFKRVRDAIRELLLTGNCLLYSYLLDFFIYLTEFIIACRIPGYT